MRKICFVLTSPFAVNGFMLTHFRILADHFEITLVVNTHEYALSSAIDPRVRVLHCDIARPISPWQDIKTLRWLVSLFRKEHFALVHSITPKAGLLAMLAARLAGVPLRIHTFTGQVWASRQGASRWFLKAMDRLIVYFSNRVLTDSLSQAKFLEQEGVVALGEVGVAGPGSISGVDLDRFRPDAVARAALRAELGINDAAIVFLYLGRITRDKGVGELASAFRRVANQHRHAFLIIAGPDEGGLAGAVQEVLRDVTDQVALIPRVVQAERYLAASDILVIPSYREGFGTVVLEAAAVGLPTVGSRIYGLTDAVLDNITGVLVPVRDEASLAGAMNTMVVSAERRHEFGRRARQRVAESFSAESISLAWLAEYHVLLNEKRS